MMKTPTESVVRWELLVVLLVCFCCTCTIDGFQPSVPAFYHRQSATNLIGRSATFLQAENKKGESSTFFLDNDNEETKKSEANDSSTTTTTSSANKRQQQQQQQEDPAEQFLASFQRGGELIKNGGGSLFKTLSQNELLGAVLDASGQIAQDIFCIFRRTAANALTASLPPDEREELLERTLGREKVEQARRQSKSTGDDDEYDATLSVNENVAAAAVKKNQQQKDKMSAAQWEQEKADIYKQAEQAATERVETELAIQRQRMDQEKRKYAQGAKAAIQDLSQQKDALEALQKTIEQEREALRAEETDTTQKQSAVAEDQNDTLNAMEAALKEKEEQAKEDQEKIEALAKQLEAASKAGTSEANPRIRAGRYTADEYRSLTDEEKEQVKALRENEGIAIADEQNTSSVESEIDVHPVLGPVIQDFGYKRIHVLSAGKLGTIPIWKKQRIYRHERARSMVNDKWKSMDLGLPGIICLHEDKNGKLAIVDGQHRVGMMMLLRDKQRKFQLENEDEQQTEGTIDFERVLVEVYPHRETDDEEEEEDEERHVQDLFLEINKAEPVKLIDMPGVAKAKDRKVITEAVDELYDMFPSMFSPSQRCRIPNVNVDNMRNNLFGANVMTTHKLTTSKKLLSWLVEQNKVLGEKYENNEEARAEVSPKAWKKASDNQFYLGLESRWLYN